MKLRKCIALLLLLAMVLTLAPSVAYAEPPVGPCPSQTATRNDGNHFWNHTGHKDPTCLDPGYDTYHCVYCGQDYTEYLPALGHYWWGPQVVKEPTCTEDGLNHYVCLRNTDHEYYATVPALGHDWTDWYVVKEPTLTEEGMEERKCQRCGLTEQRPIPKLGEKEVYSLALIMTQSNPAGNVFAYEDVFDEEGGILLLYDVTLINTGLDPMNIRDFVGGNGVASTIETVVLYPGEHASFSMLWHFDPADINIASGSDGVYGTANYNFCFFGDDFDGYQVCASNTVPFAYTVNDPEGFEEWDITESSVKVWKELLNVPADPNGWQLNETLTYVIYVENTGDLDIKDLTIYDDMNGYPEQALITVDLAVNEVKAVTFQHTVTPEDVNTGYISNLGRARWADPDDGDPLESHSTPINATVINKAGLVLIKTVVGEPKNKKFYVPGEKVHFQVTVINNTGVTQKALMVVDPLVGETKVCPDIEPGKSTTVDFYYEVTEFDAIMTYVENYAYTMEIDGISNIVIVDTGFEDDPPIGFITAIEVTKEETSTYTNGHGYELDDVITFVITVKNVGETLIAEGTVHDSLAPGSGEIAYFDNLYPDTSRTYTFTHKVDEADINYGKVVNQAFVWVGDDLYPSNIVECPTWSETPIDHNWDDPLPGDDFCSRTLTGKGNRTDAFTLHFCSEHLKVLEELEELKATATSEEEYLQAVRIAWTEAMDAMYEEAASRMNSEDAAALMEQRLTWLTYLDTYEALLNSIYPDAPLTVAQELARETRERCIDLCYDLHEAGKARPDNILGSHEELAAATPGETCVRTEGQRDKAELPYTEVLCADHAVIDEKATALAKEAQNKEARENAFLRAQRMWQAPMNTRTNARYKAADKDGKALIAKNRKAFDKYLAARKALLTFLYPNQPDVVAQIIARMIQDKEMDLCRLWK